MAFLKELSEILVGIADNAVGCENLSNKMRWMKHERSCEKSTNDTITEGGAL